MNVFEGEEEFLMDLIKELTKDQIRTDLPELEVGSTVKVHVKVKDCLLYTSRRNSNRLRLPCGFVFVGHRRPKRRTFAVSRFFGQPFV